MQFLMRPKDEFLQHAPLEALHRASREWLSEIGLWKQEVEFLHRLIDRDLVKFVREESPEKALEIVAKLEEWRDSILPGLKRSVEKHEKHLAVLVENPFTDNEVAFRAEHERLENAIHEFMEEFKGLKLAVFIGM